jgi:hypothetical protein
MARRNLAGLLTVVGAFVLVACSDQTPVAPSLNAGAGDVHVLARAALGSYELSFYTNGLQPVSSLPVFEELVLGAHVAASGVAAQGGLVTFQYCSLKALPPNDITRADEAPSAACATNDAKWANLLSVPVDGSGNAYMNFGFAAIPRTVGFRFKYTGQGSGIANGFSLPRDFTWDPIV